MKEVTISGEGTVYDISLNACDLRLLRLPLKNRARRSEMSTSLPITRPMIVSVGFPAEELDGLLDGTLVEVGVLVNDVEDGASC